MYIYYEHSMYISHIYVWLRYRPDSELIKKKEKTCQRVDFAVPAYHWFKDKKVAWQISGSYQRA